MWVMFVCFERRHYNKSPLSFFANYLEWKEKYPELAHAIENNIAAFVDEYGVENTHSILTRSSKITDTAEMLITKMKDIFANKETQQHFPETFGHEKDHSFSQGQMRRAKLKAAKFLQSLFSKIAGGNPRVCKREISGKLYWIMPALFKEIMADKRVLPLAFQSTAPPKMNLACDHPNCTQPTNVSSSWQINEGCGHSFHLSCVQVDKPCPICQEYIRATCTTLAQVAKDAIINGSEQRSADHDEDENDIESMSIANLSEEACQQEVARINDSLKILVPPTLTSEPADITTTGDRIKKGPHCKVCNHTTRGHKGRGNSKQCKDCPSGACSNAGRSIPCQCEWHANQTA